MGLFSKKKQGSVVSTTEYLPYNSFSPPLSSTKDASFTDFTPMNIYERRDLRYKTNIRLLRFVTRTISLVLSTYMIYTMTFTLLTFFHTQSIPRPSSPDIPIWGTSRKIVWPTYLILSISAVTALMNIITMGAYLLSIRAANESGDFTVFAGYVMLAIEIVVWGLGSGVYKWQDKGDDLWGFSCTMKKKGGGLLEEVKQFVDFRGLCSKQDITWIACIVQVVFHFLTVITLIMVLRRMNGKKKMEAIRISHSSAEQYAKSPPLETPDAHRPKFWKKYIPVARTS